MTVDPGFVLLRATLLQRRPFHAVLQVGAIAATVPDEDLSVATEAALADAALGDTLDVRIRAARVRAIGWRAAEGPAPAQPAAEGAAP